MNMSLLKYVLNIYVNKIVREEMVKNQAPLFKKCDSCTFKSEEIRVP